MSQQRIALFSLTGISYGGSDLGSQFTINITANGEPNPKQLTIPVGSTQPFLDHLHGLPAPEVPAPLNMPVNVTVSGFFMGSPVNGFASQVFTIAPAPDTQLFTMPVQLNSPERPPATFTVSFRVVYREYPVCYDPEWLCRNRHNWATFQRWLCLGMTEVPNFLTLPSVVLLQQTMVTEIPHLNRLNTERALGYVPPPVGAPFPLLQDYTFDVTMAAATHIPTLSWARLYIIDDFAVRVDDLMFDYVIAIHDLVTWLDFELCRRWRDLLDCYCRFCRLRAQMPPAALTLYDSHAAPQINLLYDEMVSVVQQEGLDYYILPNPSINCDKLAYIVSVWAWWCRLCGPLGPEGPAWAVGLEGYYDSLYNTRELMNDILEAESWFICNPPEKNFCSRWLDILNCLKKLCDGRAQLSTALVNDIESTFGAIVRSVFAFMGLTGVSNSPGIANTCAMIAKIQGPISFMCNENTVAGARTRRDTLDTMLVQAEQNMTGFKSRNGNLCAPTTPMTGCGNWTPILDCLANLCTNRIVMTSALSTALINGFSTVLNNLLAVTHPGVSMPSLQPLDLFCHKVSLLRGFFLTICPAGSVDPVKKLRLEFYLSSLQSAYSTLLAGYPNICQNSVSLTPTWCDEWDAALDCLKRICTNSRNLSDSIIGDFVSTFGGVVDRLDWLSQGPVSSYSARTMTLTRICEALDRIRHYLEQICGEGDIDPVRKLRLDAEKATLLSAYTQFIAEYPGICYEHDQFCEDWVQIFDCLVRVADRWETYPTDQRATALMTMIDTNMGGALDTVYTIAFDAPLVSPFPTTNHRLSYQTRTLRGWFVQHCACCDGDMPSAKRTQLQEPHVVVRSVYRNLVQCDVDCTTSQLDLMTGSAPWMITQADNAPLERPRTPHIVTNTAGIGAPVGSSDWISPRETAADPIIGWTYFERCFCVCTAGTIRIELEYRADDFAIINLDGTELDRPTQPNMTGPRSMDQTRTVTAGRHCIRVFVRNDPAVNMAFSAEGTITAVTAELLAEGCCGDGEHPVGFCENIGPACEQIYRLPVLYRFLCCPSRSGSDPIFSHATFTTLSSELTCFEGQIPRIALSLGLTPDDLPWPGSAFCDRLRRAVRLMLAAFSNFGRLTAIERHIVLCFYDLLNASVATLAETEIDKPLPCTPSCTTCEGWRELLGCLCRLCDARRNLTPELGWLAGEIDDMVCTDLNGLYTWATGTGAAGVPLVHPWEEPNTCCLRLPAIIQVLADHCLCCTTMAPSIQTSIESYYTTLKPVIETMAATASSAGVPACDNECAARSTMLECLVQLCLRRGELSTKQRTRFDTLLASPVSSLYMAVFQTFAPSSPLPVDVMGNTCWAVYLIARRNTWLCSPYYVWDAAQRKEVDAAFADLAGAYATLIAELGGTAGYICSSNLDHCGRAERLPGLFSNVCGSTPNSGLQPVIAINAMLGVFKNDIPSLQKQLGLPAVTYPTNGTFCDRLEMALGVVAAAESRYQELAPAYRIAIEFFYGVFSSQAVAYTWYAPNEVPRPETAMSAFRARWMEMLTCVCRACDLVAGFNGSERITHAAIVQMIESAGPLSAAVDALQATVIAQAPINNVPLVPDPCATTMCRRLRIVISFFDSYCLRCTEPGAGVVGVLEGLFEALRTAVVNLRSELAKANRNVCGDENMGSVVVQSESLYLQAAGSSGADGSSKGVHLRWALMGGLVEHLPKGNLARPGTLYYGDNPMNRADDFVTIYRAPYKLTERFAVTVDFSTRIPVVSGTIADGVEWKFENISFDDAFPGSVTTVTVSFDPGLYPLAIPGTITQAHVLNVVQAYTGVFRVAAIPKLMFAFEVVQQATGANPQTQFEAISRNNDPNSDDPNFLSCRETTTGGVGQHRITSEAIDAVYFKCTNAWPRQIILETFEDFYQGTRRRYLWKRMESFALTTDTTTAHKRLEEPARFTIDGRWPRYDASSGTLASGTMRVNVVNYRDRWEPGATHGRSPEQSIRKAVVDYLDASKSRDNLPAWVDKQSTMPGDETYMRLSLLQLLQLGAQDYHVARMLGLGHIDAPLPLADPSDAQQFMYYAEYRSGSGADAITHRYLSLPTGQYDYRLPIAPTIDRITLGLEAPYTDNAGYTRYGDVRYLKLYRDPLPFDLPVDVFYGSVDRYSRGKQSRPIQYGVKYGAMQGPNPNDPVAWDVPGPSNDDAEFTADSYVPYRDLANNAEVVPIPDFAPEADGTVLLFTHRIEKTTANIGRHKYGVYGINWFSRVSTDVNLSDVVDNQFPVRNTLLPPGNLTAQYIQPEDPPIFTTANEQAGGLFDKTRVTFNIDHTHHGAYQQADAVDLYFRPAQPMKVRGKVLQAKVTGSTVTVTTTSYTDISVAVAGGELVEPIIAPADIGRFIGSMLVTPTDRFVVISLTIDGGTGYPVFVVESIRLAGSDGQPGTGKVIAPLADELFLVGENMVRVIDEQNIYNGWQRLHNNRISLVKFNAWPYAVGPMYTEPVTTNGRTEMRVMGGLVDAQATIGKLAGSTVDGVYEVTMPNTTLFPYTTSYPGRPVDFYRGVARVQIYQKPGEVKTVDVLKIASLSPVTLYVYDSDADPDPLRKLAPAVGTTTVRVNFHPGYRAYIDLGADSIPDTDILPVAPEVSRLTYIGAKCVDTTRLSGGHPYRSAITTPAIHLARHLVEAETPELPTGPLYATRPDIYGKATYMFDTPLRSGRTVAPYGLMFYRADELAILSILYKQSTIRNVILPGLPVVEDDPHLNQRWRELIAATVDGTGQFPQYSGSTFRFPPPDRASEPNYTGRYPMFTGSAAPGTMQDAIRAAVNDAFLPMTESYVVYDRIRSDSLQTSRKKPVTRAIDGTMLNPGDADYDPYPMIRRGTLNGDTVVRFADYTLDGASRNVYFYYVRELNNELKFSMPRGPVLGPVRLVNTMPPPAPEILAVRAQSNDSVLGLLPAVTFTLAQYPEYERVTHMRIYRAQTEAAAASIRSMKMAAEVAVGGGAQVVIADTFTETPPIPVPYNEPLFYRLVAVRTITNENGVPEAVTSLPSEPVLASVMDTTNPAPPKITPDITPLPNPANPERLTDVTLRWPNNTYRGTYTLYKMSGQGQWIKVKEFAPTTDAEIVYDWSADHAGDPDLLKVDADGAPVYHRFKVSVMNSSGLVNYIDDPLVL